MTIGSPPDGHPLATDSAFWTVLTAISVACYAISAAVLIPWLQHEINLDAISYHRLATYWRSGDTDLAISGYWGPLTSWIMAPFVTVVDEPAVLGRATTAFGGAVFVAGALMLFRVFGLSKACAFIAGTSTTVFAIAYFTRSIHPDLLFSGLILLGMAAQVRALQFDSLRWGIISGCSFGVAYLVKTPGVLFGIGVLLSFPVIVVFLRERKASGYLKAVMGSWIPFLAVCAVWVTVLSMHYGEFTWTTAGKRAQQLTAEGHIHPNFHFFHAPREGRVTSWEDPTEFNGPRLSGASLDPSSLVRIVYQNTLLIIEFLGGMDLLGALLILAILSVLLIPKGGFSVLDRPWRLGLLSTAMICAPYAVSYADSNRYFFACFPLLLGASCGLIDWAHRRGLLGWTTSRGKRHSTLPVVLVLLLAIVLFPHQQALRYRLAPMIEQGQASDYGKARRVAKCLRQLGLEGSIAELGRFSAVPIRVAFAANTAFLGAEGRPESLEGLMQLKPSVVFVHDEKPLRSAIDSTGRFRNVTGAFPAADLGHAGTTYVVYAADSYPSITGHCGE